MKRITMFLKKHNDNYQTGFYSVNETALFFIVCVFCIGLFIPDLLKIPLEKTNNRYILDIYRACIKPLSDFSKKNKFDLFVNSIRKSFLTYTKLDAYSEWDVFFYDKFYSEENQAALQNKLTADQLTAQIIILEKKLIELKTLTEELEQLNAQKNELRSTARDETGIINYDLYFGKENSINSVDFNLLRENIIKVDNLQMSLDTPIKTDTSKTLTEKQQFHYTAQNPLKVLMIGDSQMQSIAGGFIRALGENAPVKIKDISVHSSGFVRSDYYNWPKKLETIFAETKDSPYDAAIIFLGMNDYQNFYSSNGKVLIKESKDWEISYKEKIKKHLDILLSNTKKIYWLGMPLVRNKVYNEDLKYIDKLHEQVAEEYGNNLVRFSMIKIAPGDGMEYVDIIQKPDGTKIKLMRDDGIHYTISGGEYIMQKFLDVLYSDWEISKKTE